jgi:hypothetical protein
MRIGKSMPGLTRGLVPLKNEWHPNGSPPASGPGRNSETQRVCTPHCWMLGKVPFKYQHHAVKMRHLKGQSTDFRKNDSHPQVCAPEHGLEVQINHRFTAFHY